MWALALDSRLIAACSWARLFKGLNYCVLAQCVDRSRHTAVNSSCNGCGGTAAGLSYCDLAVAQTMT